MIQDCLMMLNNYYLNPYHFTNANVIVGCILVSMAVIAVVSSFFLSKRTWKHLNGSICIMFWIFTIVSATMLGRVRSPEPNVNFRLFWCIKEAWTLHDAYDWYFVIGNILLFIPLGFFVAATFRSMRKLWRVGVVGLLLSTVIEVSQYVLHLGLCELDDVFGNTLGCVMGGGLFLICLYCVRRQQSDRGRVIIAACLWIFVILFFTVALYLNKPDFSWLF